MMWIFDLHNAYINPYFMHPVGVMHTVHIIHNQPLNMAQTLVLF